MKRPNYGRTPTYLIFMKNQRVWWSSTKGEVYDLWKPLGFPIVPKLLSCCTADRSLLWSCGLCWEVYSCQQEEMWPSGVLRFLHTGKNQLQMEQAWFPGRWERRWKQQGELCSEITGNLLITGVVESDFIWGFIYSFTYWTVFPNGWIPTKNPSPFFSIKLRWLVQLILFFR